MMCKTVLLAIHSLLLMMYGPCIDATSTARLFKRMTPARHALAPIALLSTQLQQQPHPQQSMDSHEIQATDKSEESRQQYEEVIPVYRDGRVIGQTHLRRPLHPNTPISASEAAKLMPRNQGILENYLRKEISYSSEDTERWQAEIEKTIAESIPRLDTAAMTQFADRYLSGKMRLLARIVINRSANQEWTTSLVDYSINQIRVYLDDISKLPIIDLLVRNVRPSIDSYLSECGYWNAMRDALMDRRKLASDWLRHFHPQLMRSVEQEGLEMMADFYSVQIAYQLELELCSLVKSAIRLLWPSNGNQNGYNATAIDSILMPRKPEFQHQLWANLELSGDDGAEVGSRRRIAENPLWAFNYKHHSKQQTNARRLAKKATMEVLRPIIAESAVTVAELAAKSIAAIGKSVHLVVRQAFSAPLVRQAILRTIEQEFFKAYRERLGVEVVAAAK